MIPVPSAIGDDRNHVHASIPDLPSSSSFYSRKVGIPHSLHTTIVSFLKERASQVGSTPLLSPGVVALKSSLNPSVRSNILENLTVGALTPDHTLDYALCLTNNDMTSRFFADLAMTLSEKGIGQDEAAYSLPALLGRQTPATRSLLAHALQVYLLTPNCNIIAMPPRDGLSLVGNEARVEQVYMVRQRADPDEPTRVLQLVSDGQVG